MKNILMLAISLIVIPNAAFSITYQLSGQLTSASVTDGIGNRSLSVYGSNVSTISGTLEVNGSNYSLNLLIDGPDLYDNTDIGNVILDTGTFNYSASGSIGSNGELIESGGHGSYYYEILSNSSYVDEHVSPQQSNQVGIEIFGGAAVFSSLSSLHIDRIGLGGTMTETEYYYADDSQEGTPTIYSYSYPILPDASVSMQLTHDFQVNTFNNQIVENFEFYLTPVPLPASGWLLSLAIGGLLLKKREHRKSV